MNKVRCEMCDGIGRRYNKSVSGKLTSTRCSRCGGTGKIPVRTEAEEKAAKHDFGTFILGRHAACVLIIAVACFATGCASIQEWLDNREQPEPVPTEPDQPAPIPAEPEQPDPDPVTDIPGPVDPMSVPEIGEFIPDPMVVRYELVFADSTRLTFRENHSGDYWGDEPAAGHGRIVWPNGREELKDINTIVRHGGLHIAKTPVTTLTHGGRMFWMADSEGRLNVKHVDIFEDGWNPLVEGAVLATQHKLGITAPLVECNTTVEKRKAR